MSTMTLAEALRVTATRIESEPENYSFARCDSCNAGHLFKTVSGMNDLKSRALVNSLESGVTGIWSTLIRSPLATCPIAEVPMNTVIVILRNFGISAIQMRDLERLSDLEIRRRAGLGLIEDGLFDKRIFPFRDCSILNSVVLYMRAWATMLEEQFDEMLNAAPALESAEKLV